MEFKIVPLIIEPLWTLQQEVLGLAFKGGRPKSGQFRE